MPQLRVDSLPADVIDGRQVKAITQQPQSVPANRLAPGKKPDDRRLTGKSVMEDESA